MAAPMAIRRVLVHVKNSSDASSIPAKFSQVSPLVNLMCHIYLSIKPFDFLVVGGGVSFNSSSENQENNILVRWTKCER